jgi:hypothetical protein
MAGLRGHIQRQTMHDGAIPKARRVVHLRLAVQQAPLVQAVAACHCRRDAHVRQNDLALVVNQDVAGLQL